MDPSLAVSIVLVGAAVIAFEVGISSAIVEVFAGVALAYFIKDIGSLGWLQFLANLGMLGLMFMAGFEVDPQRLRRSWRASVAIGVCSLLLPMAGVFLICFYGFGLALNVAGLVAIVLVASGASLFADGVGGFNEGYACGD